MISIFLPYMVRHTRLFNLPSYYCLRCENNNKDEDNSLKNLNDKNQQASSPKFRQLIIYNYIYIYIYIYIYSRLSVYLGIITIFVWQTLPDLKVNEEFHSL